MILDYRFENNTVDVLIAREWIVESSDDGTFVACPNLNTAKWVAFIKIENNTPQYLNTDILNEPIKVK